MQVFWLYITFEVIYYQAITLSLIMESSADSATPAFQRGTAKINNYKILILLSYNKLVCRLKPLKRQDEPIQRFP
jgi:hypothetical protein